MRIDDELEFRQTCDQVATALAAPGFVRVRAEFQHAHHVSVEVSGDPASGFTVISSRTQDTDRVPAQLRNLVGNGLTLRQTDTWSAPAEDGSRSGTIALEVSGFPVRFTGTLTLSPAGSGCVERLSGDLRASVPLFGGRVEQAAAPAILAAVRAEARAAQRWFEQT